MLARRLKIMLWQSKGVIVFLFEKHRNSRHAGRQWWLSSYLANFQFLKSSLMLVREVPRYFFVVSVPG